MPEAPGKAPLPQGDPKVAAQTVRRVFKKVAQEIDVEKYGLNGLISALEKALGIRNESLNAEDQEALVEFLGSEATTEFLLVAEDVPAISPQRARTVASRFDVLMRAVKSDAERDTVWRLGRVLGHELISAFADQTIRG